MKIGKVKPLPFSLPGDAAMGEAVRGLAGKRSAVMLADLPPGRPSVITRVLGFDTGRFRVGQARRARSPQIAKAYGALLLGSDCPARSAV
jgi:hypothetical protein